jgi:hypothetical protein
MDMTRTAIVYAIWGDHAFFYSPGEAAQHAAKMQVCERLEVPKLALLPYDEADCKVRFDQMRAFDPDELEIYMVWRRLKVNMTYRNRKADKKRKVAKPTKLSDDEVAQQLCENLQLRRDNMERSVPQLAVPDALRLVKEMKDWSGVFHVIDIEAASEQIALMQFPFHRALGSKLRQAVELRMRATKAGTFERACCVRKVSEHHLFMARLAERVSSECRNIPIEYYGDEPATLSDRIYRRLLGPEPRVRLAEGARAAVWLSQGNACHKCRKQTQQYEIDHIVPVCSGGSNDRANLRGLCRTCHHEATQIQRESGVLKYEGLVSQMSPRIANLFVLDADKPKPYHGGFDDHHLDET